MGREVWLDWTSRVVEGAEVEDSMVVINVELEDFVVVATEDRLVLREVLVPVIFEDKLVSEMIVAGMS